MGTPDWWHSLPSDQPVIFVTLGSSGDSLFLPMILETLSVIPVIVICVTANKTVVNKSYANVLVAKFLSTEDAVKKADIVICNGGSPMVYQGLVEYKSIIGIPRNLDQYLMMSILEAAQKGELIRSGKANLRLIEAAVNRALTACKTTQVNLSIGQIDLETTFELEKIEGIIWHSDDLKHE